MRKQKGKAGHTYMQNIASVLGYVNHCALCSRATNQHRARKSFHQLPHCNYITAFTWINSYRQRVLTASTCLQPASQRQIDILITVQSADFRFVLVYVPGLCTHQKQKLQTSTTTVLVKQVFIGILKNKKEDYYNYQQLFIDHFFHIVQKIPDGLLDSHT